MSTWIAFRKRRGMSGGDPSVTVMEKRKTRLIPKEVYVLKNKKDISVTPRQFVAKIRIGGDLYEVYNIPKKNIPLDNVVMTVKRSGKNFKVADFKYTPPSPTINNTANDTFSNKLQRLIDMGFNRAKAVKALQIHNGNVQRAAETLLNSTSASATAATAATSASVATAATAATATAATAATAATSTAAPAAPAATSTATEKQLKILTYNISFEAMIGNYRNPQPYEQLCEGDTGNPTICQKNIAKFIEVNKPYSFIALQEASRYYNFKNLVPYIQNNMTEVQHKSLNEEMVTYYDKTLSKPLEIKSEFTPGRPFQVLVFQQEQLIFINVHCGHNIGSVSSLNNEFTSKILKVISKYPIAKKIFEDKTNGNIIIAGDFNYIISAGKRFKLMDRQFTNIKQNQSTCCDDHNNNKWNPNSHGKVDNILFSGNLKEVNSQAFIVAPASDHLPVIATLEY